MKNTEKQWIHLPTGSAVRKNSEVMDKFENRLSGKSNVSLPSVPYVAQQMIAVLFQQSEKCRIPKIKQCSFQGTWFCMFYKRSLHLLFGRQQVKINLVLFNTKQSFPLRHCTVKPKPVHGYFILFQCDICCQITCTWLKSDFIQRPLKLIAGFPLALVYLRQKALQRIHKEPVRQSWEVMQQTRHQVHISICGPCDPQ